MFHPSQMSPADTALLVIDVQEKLIPKIRDADALVRNIAFLLDAAHLLGVPALATEQYPRGLGPTVAALRQHLPERPDKVGFSCCAVPSVVEQLRAGGRAKVLLAGIETHVCVLHTALDLLALDFRVYVAADAVGSRYPLDHDLGLRRMEGAGATLVTAETAVFEWAGGANHPAFKELSRLVKDRSLAQV
jgi:nicotinamidase-related amidase